jgi:hypothetical protein
LTRLVTGQTKASPIRLLPADRGRSALRLRLSRLPESRQLLALLDASRIGVELSDEDQLWPEQSTSAIVLHHPQARYFNVWRPPGDGLTFEAQDLPRPASRIKVGR